MSWRLRAVAGALRFPFELLVKMYTNNYSGGRLSLIDGRITFRCWQGQSIDSTWERIANRFSDELVITGEVAISPEDYQAMPWIYRRHAWIPPGWPWVDPMKEVQSELAAVEGKLGTRAKSLAGVGEDWEEINDQHTRERLADLEADAKVERLRAKLAAELGDETFGREIKPADTQYEPEPVGVSGDE